MEAFETELVSQQERVEQISAIAGELHSLGYHDAGKINSRCKHICDQWDRIGAQTQARKRGILDAEKVLESVDHLHQEFARRVAVSYSSTPPPPRKGGCPLDLLYTGGLLTFFKGGMGLWAPIPLFSLHNYVVLGGRMTLSNYDTYGAGGEVGSGSRREKL